MAKIDVPSPGEDFWRRALPKRATTESARLEAFEGLVREVGRATHMQLYQAMRAGVPTLTVDLIREATHWPVNHVFSVIGLRSTTYRRMEGAKKPLPDAAGRRVMALLRVAALLRRLLAESGDPASIASSEINQWLAAWLSEPQEALHGRRPVDLLENPEGALAVEELMERMRGGLPA